MPLSREIKLKYKLVVKWLLEESSKESLEPRQKLKKLLAILSDESHSDYGNILSTLAVLYKTGQFKILKSDKPLEYQVLITELTFYKIRDLQELTKNKNADELAEIREFIKTEIELFVSMMYSDDFMDKDIFHYLIQKKFNFNAQIQPGNTLEELINPNLSAEERSWRNTFMHTMIANEVEECVKFFLDNVLKNEIDIDFNLTDRDGKSVFSLMLRIPNPTIRKYPIQLLQANKIRIDIPDNNGNTPLHICAYLGLQECFEEIVKMDKKTLNSKNKAGLTPLDILNNSDARITEAIKIYDMAGIDPSRDCDARKNLFYSQELTGLVWFKCVEPRFYSWLKENGYVSEEEDEENFQDNDESYYKPNSEIPYNHKFIERLVEAEENALKRKSPLSPLGFFDWEDNKIESVSSDDKEKLVILHKAIECLKTAANSLRGESVLDVSTEGFEKLRSKYCGVSSTQDSPVSQTQFFQSLTTPRSKNMEQPSLKRNISELKQNNENKEEELDPNKEKEEELDLRSKFQRSNSG